MPSSTRDRPAGAAPLAAARAALGLLLQDPALCPGASIRCDQAGYLAGRCSYEVGSIQNDQAAFQDARARLDAMQAAFPASARIADAAYFDGRARFQLVSGFGLGGYADAELQFERSLSPGWPAPSPTTPSTTTGAASSSRGWPW